MSFQQEAHRDGDVGHVAQDAAGRLLHVGVQVNGINNQHVASFLSKGSNRLVYLAAPVKDAAGATTNL